MEHTDWTTLKINEDSLTHFALSRLGCSLCFMCTDAVVTMIIFMEHLSLIYCHSEATAKGTDVGHPCSQPNSRRSLRSRARFCRSYIRNLQSSPLHKPQELRGAFLSCRMSEFFPCFSTLWGSHFQHGLCWPTPDISSPPRPPVSAPTLIHSGPDTRQKHANLFRFFTGRMDLFSRVGSCQGDPARPVRFPTRSDPTRPVP